MYGVGFAVARFMLWFGQGSGLMTVSLVCTSRQYYRLRAGARTAAVEPGDDVVWIALP